jgi:integrase
MAKALTVAAVAKLRAGKARREIPDGTSGLRLVIQPSGAKSWAVRFRRPNGKPAKLTLGSCDDNGKEGEGEPVIGGHLTLVAARRLATETRRQLALGRDPAAAYLAEKQRARAAAIETSANTFAVAARDFVEQYARKKVRRWSEQARLLGLQPADLSLMPKGLAERWRDRPVAEIDGHDIHGIIDETRRMGAPGLERRSEGQTESRARAMHACLSKMFGWLVQHRRVAANPVAGVHSPDAAPARDRVLTDAEVVAFWGATNTVGEPFGVLLKLLALTGCRLNEIARMTWDELSGDLAILHLPGERAKNHRPHNLPLPPLARELLAGVKRIEGCRFVFSTNGRTPVSGFSKIKARLDATMAIPPWKLHDLRRTVASGLQRLGVALPVTERVLNHVSGSFSGIVGVYQRHEYAEEQRIALERWAAHVAELVEGKPAGVVPIRGRR